MPDYAVHRSSTFRPGSDNAPGPLAAYPVGLPPVAASPLAARYANAGATSAAPYRINDQGWLEETQKLDVTGQPSLRMYQQAASQNTVVSLLRRTQYMKWVDDGDLQGVRSLAESVYALLKNMSQGPYTTRLLRQMGYPYGFAQRPSPGQPTYAGRRVPRAVQGHGRIGAVKTVRGSVPNMTVVNRQSGKFLGAWRWNYAIDANGVTLNWWNEAKSSRAFPYSWALAHGTIKMQPHFPAPYAVLVFIDHINGEWARVVKRAWMRDQAEKALRWSTEGTEVNEP